MTSLCFFTRVIRKMANIFADVSFMFIQKPILLMDKSNKFELEGKLRNRINYGKDVSIGNHTWICYGVRVMKGTNIGSDCVVGSNTMITGISTGDNILVVGNPAKVVKSGINWTIKRILDK